MTVLRPLVVAWGGLLLLLLLQLGSAILLHLPAGASVFGAAEAVVVILVFMRIRNGSPLMRIFGAAGLFWLIVLLTLGSLDPVTRTDYPVPPTAEGR
jgi:cytochrome c oxidase subunit 4